MNSNFIVHKLPSLRSSIITLFQQAYELVFPLASLTLMLWLCGCGNRDLVRVQLHAHAPIVQGVPSLDITAQVAGRQTGLRYEWFSVAGGCDPQKSDSPKTTFRFADGTMRDRVSVDVWRDNQLVGRSEVDVKLDQIQGRLMTEDAQPEQAQIEITNVPPYEPKGGSDTRADISGTASGKLESGYSVVLYARASEMWYIQPIAYAAHAVHPDNCWSTWTHTGSSYAALLVRPGFEPVPRLDVLPKVGGYVVARTIVDGVKK